MPKLKMHLLIWARSNLVLCALNLGAWCNQDGAAGFPIGDEIICYWCVYNPEAEEDELSLLIQSVTTKLTINYTKYF